jgi:hypothetical protein
MFAVHGFAETIPFPENGGKAPNQRIRLIVPETEFQTRGETHSWRLDEPDAVIGDEFLDPYPGWYLTDEWNQHR